MRLSESSLGPVGTSEARVKGPWGAILSTLVTSGEASPAQVEVEAALGKVVSPAVYRDLLGGGASTGRKLVQSGRKKYPSASRGTPRMTFPRAAPRNDRQQEARDQASAHPDLALLASKLAALTSWLLADMVEEECSLLNPDVVREDVVVVDQNFG